MFFLQAESDLSEGIPVAGRGRGKSVGGGQWGVVEGEEDSGEQRVVLQGIRLRGNYMYVYMHLYLCT